MKPIWKIDGEDFTSYIAVGKLKWTRNDLESATSGRTTLDGVMHRNRIAQKRKLNVTCRRLTFTEIQKLSTALNPEFIQVTYLDPELGITTKTFYGTSVSGTTQAYLNGSVQFDDTQFELVER